jgi:hypothetical protein
VIEHQIVFRTPVAAASGHPTGPSSVSRSNAQSICHAICDDGLLKTNREEYPMPTKNIPVLIGASLLVSGTLIAGLASADMDRGDNKDGHRGQKISAKKLDVN